MTRSTLLSLRSNADRDFAAQEGRLSELPARARTMVSRECHRWVQSLRNPEAHGRGEGTRRRAAAFGRSMGRPATLKGMHMAKLTPNDLTSDQLRSRTCADEPRRSRYARACS